MTRGERDRDRQSLGVGVVGIRERGVVGWRGRSERIRVGHHKRVMAEEDIRVGSRVVTNKIKQKRTKEYKIKIIQTK